MYGQRENPYGDPYRRRPPMDPYGRGGYGGYGFVCFGDCMDMSTYVLPGLVVLSLFIGLILFIAGFSAPYWITSGDANVGLWKSCDGMDDETCKNLVGEDSFDLQWFTATQAMTTISLVFLILAFAMLAYWLCTEARFFFIKALIISLLFMTFIFLIVSIGFFGGNYDDEMTFDNYDLDWGFYLVLVSSILILLGGCFLLCVSSYGSYPDFTFRDRFGFGAGRGFGGPGSGGPGPNPAYGAYGASRDVYGTGLPYTARY